MMKCSWPSLQMKRLQDQCSIADACLPTQMFPRRPQGLRHITVQLTSGLSLDGRYRKEVLQQSQMFPKNICPREATFYLIESERRILNNTGGGLIFILLCQSVTVYLNTHGRVVAIKGIIKSWGLRICTFNTVVTTAYYSALFCSQHK